MELRDAHSAKHIARLRSQYPEAIVYVVYGELHLARARLPKLTRQALAPEDDARMLTIFQNSEAMYWKLASRGLEEKVDVLKLREDVFCIVNSPPWMKWQSYLHFLEASVESDVEGTKDAMDYSDHISNIVEVIKKLWAIEGTFLDFYVYTSGDKKFPHPLRLLKAADQKLLKQLIKNKKNFFVSRPAVLYFSDFGMNNGADLSGRYIHAKLRREKNLHFQFPKDFPCQIWLEAIGFFASPHG